MYHPLFAFLVPWIFVLVGQQLALCRIIQPFFSPFYFVLLGNGFTALLLAFFFRTKKNKRVPTLNFRPVLLFSICIYFAFQCMQVVYFKGFPLLWLLMGDSRAYIDFGIQSLNGLFNALYLIATTALFLTKRRFFDRFLFLILLCVPILLVSRQLLMSLFFQISCCYLIYYPKAWKKLVVGGVLLLTTFVVLGNVRTGVKELTTILGPEEVVPESCYPLLWIYAYCVTPFNNINAACDNVTPVGAPLHELNALLPSFLRDKLVPDIDDTGFRLVHKNMTVSTFYYPLLLDFGMWYCFFFMFLFQVMTFCAYRRAMKTAHPVDVMQYAVLYMVMVLSIFSNLLLFLPVLFQLVILRLFQLRLTRRDGILVFDSSRKGGQNLCHS